MKDLSNARTLRIKRNCIQITFIIIVSIIITVYTGTHSGHSIRYLAARGVYVFLLLMGLYMIRPKGNLHSKTFESVSVKEKSFTIIPVLALCIFAATFPMAVNPIWNGEIPEHRNQYEEMADAILDGHLYIDHGNISQELLDMDNPYDKDARTEAGVEYEWDHAFYNGHYYMYFGVVPVFLLFIPYKLLFGRSLVTYHATQIFTALIIVGIFTLFYKLVRHYCPKITWGGIFRCRWRCPG